MARHAATSTRRRSSSAERAHRAGLVTGTIDLTSSSPAAVRERLVNTAARNGGALAIVATTVWIYDIARIVRGA
ncbi:MAG: hypothetical protein QOD07_619 [Frankiaceae bacterium]|jgi:hypothetical protein|nr:hypothetical protein [Frankiaceae bacterium]